MINIARDWVRYLFFSYHSFAMRYDSKKGAAFYASFMIALNIVLFIFNALFFLELFFNFETNLKSWQIGAGSLVIGFSIFIYYRTNNRYENILAYVNRIFEHRNIEKQIKIVAIILPLLQCLSMIILASILRGSIN